MYSYKYLKANVRLKILILIFIVVISSIAFYTLRLGALFKIDSDTNNWKIYSGDNYSFRYPNGWQLSKGNTDIKSPLGFFEFLILKNNFNYNTGQCVGCSDELEVMNYNLCLTYTPLCKQKEEHLSTNECADLKCGAVAAADLCVDSAGKKPSGGYGCVDLLKQSQEYTYYKFVLKCKQLPFLVSVQKNCIDSFKKIVGSLSFSGTDKKEWTTYTGKYYSFRYPSNLNKVESNGTVKLVTNNGLRFMVLRIDSTIKDLHAFVVNKAEVQKRMLSSARIGDREKQWWLYEFINLPGIDKKVRHDEYLVDLSNDSAKGILWIDIYVYEPEINENVLLVDEILKSFEFK